jgi:hypothetical protein
MFAPAKALEAFRTFLIRQGVNIDVLRLPTTVAAFLGFYRDERADGCALEDDSDSLLFEWGVVDWGEAEHFELSLIRQLTFGTGMPKTWQLKLTYAYEPTQIFRALGEGNCCCSAPEGLTEFRDAVELSEVYCTASRHAEIGIVSVGFYWAG